MLGLERSTNVTPCVIEKENGLNKSCGPSQLQSSIVNDVAPPEHEGELNYISKLSMLMVSTGSSVSSTSSQSDVSRKISDVWKCFTKTPDKKKAICSICHKELAYSGGTTNLCDHVSSKHPLQYIPDGYCKQNGKFEWICKAFQM